MQFQLRNEILQLITRRDSGLAEKLVRSVANNPLSNAPKFPMLSSQNEQSTLLLQMATSVADADPERAAQMAISSLNSGVNPALLLTLLSIRRKNPALADNIFRSAMLAAQRDSARMMVSIRALASYVFPNYEGEEAGEELSSLQGGYHPNPALIEEFLNFAYNAIEKQGEALTTNRSGEVNREQALFTYSTIRQLLPFFNKLMPEKAAGIRVILDNLARTFFNKEASASVNAAQQESVQRLLEMAERIPTSQQRDALYTRAAMLALRQGDADRAFSIAEKISNDQDRSGVSSVIRFQLALRAIDKGDIDTAYSHAKDLTGLEQQASVLSRIIRTLLNKKEQLRAAQILAEAKQQFTKAETGAGKAAAILTLTEVATLLDANEGFETMRLAVDALNHADFKRPEDDKPNGTIINWIKPTLETLNLDAPFSVLSRLDFDHALLLAQSLEKREISALAQLAVCREALTRTRDKESDSKARSSDKAGKAKNEKEEQPVIRQKE